jgi:hypothetical protein
MVVISIYFANTTFHKAKCRLCASWRLLIRSWYNDIDCGSCHLPDLEIRLTAVVTGRQGMLTPLMSHNVPDLWYIHRSVLTPFWFEFPAGLTRIITVRYIYVILLYIFLVAISLFLVIRSSDSLLYFHCNDIGGVIELGFPSMIHEFESVIIQGVSANMSRLLSIMKSITRYSWNLKMDLWKVYQCTILLTYMFL